MKKGPKKPRAPKPKAPKSSKLRQKQKQSVNVKIHINNSRPARKAAPRAHASPFPQPISSYPIFRDILPPPPPHYNPAPVAQAPAVAQGFHGIPPATTRARRTPSRSVSNGYASDLSDISDSSTLRTMSNLNSIPQSIIRRPVARRTPQRGIVIGSGNTSDASNSTASAMSGLGSMNNSGSIGSRGSRNTPIIPRAPIPTGYISTPADRRAERLRTGTPAVSLQQLRTHIAPASPSIFPLRYEGIYPSLDSNFSASRPGRSDKDSKR